ncbi:MAG: signal peptidase [Actinomycetota bacterium]|jgi:signal peptidase I|nr:signal peptidase [Actinomycetota bacterium]
MLRVARVFAAVLAGLLALGVVVVAWPQAFGGRASWTVVSGTSMEPRLHTGDLVLAWDTGAWDVGDTVVYGTVSNDGRMSANTIHRIVGGDPSSGWELRGDNKTEADPGTIADSRVVGEEVLAIPRAGMLLMGVRQPLVLAALLAGALALIIAGATYLLLSIPDDTDDPDDDPNAELPAEEAPTPA